MSQNPKVRIDLVSDTASRPSPEMRKAMAEAEVGDEQRGEDPTVNALNEHVAELLGQESAMFLPSGTMCNQVALATHCRAGDEIIAADASHILGSEGAGAAIFAGCFVRTLPTERGIFTGDDVHAAVRPEKVKSPRTRLVEVEQTANRGGGSVWLLEEITSVVEAARSHDLLLHMDGARLMNAVVASGTPAAKFAGPFDSVWLDLSKGLGCPIGGVLAGSAAFIEEAIPWKHRLGGAMRQAGIIAAAGLYALKNNVERLAEDHENANLLAEHISAIPGMALVHERIETNLVFFDVAETGLTASEISSRLLEKGVRIGAENASRMRAVTHLDVSRENIEEAGALLAAIVKEG